MLFIIQDDEIEESFEDPEYPDDLAENLLQEKFKDQLLKDTQGLIESLSICQEPSSIVKICNQLVRAVLSSI